MDGREMERVEIHSLEDYSSALERSYILWEKAAGGDEAAEAEYNRVKAAMQEWMNTHFNDVIEEPF